MTDIPTGYKPYTTVKLRKEALHALKDAKKRLHYVDYSDLIITLAERSEALTPLATKPAILNTNAPIFLTGYSGIGKTTYTRKLVEELPPPILILDPHNDYAGVERITNPYSIGDLDFAGENRKLRYVPSSDFARKDELRTIFEALLQHKADLGRWIIITDESHILTKVSSFRNFLIEGRKFTRKIITIITDTQAYAGIGIFMQPPPYTNTNKQTETEVKQQ